MIQILLTIFLVTLVFLITLWAVKKSAQWLKAERTGYGSAAIALAVTMLASLLPQLILGQYLSPIILFILSLAITAAIYAVILGTDFLRGLGITLISNILALILVVIIFVLVGILGAGGGMMLGLSSLIPTEFNPLIDREQQAANIKQAADRVCDCGSDRACQQEHFAELTILIAQQGEDAALGNGDYEMQRARACVNYYKQQSADPDAEPTPGLPPEQQPQSGDPAQGPRNINIHISGSFSSSQHANDPVQNPGHTAVPRTSDDHKSQQRIQSPITIINTPHTNRWTYRQIGVAEAGNHLYETVRVTRRDNGTVIEGKLTQAKRSDTLALRQRRYSGIFIMEIPKAKIRKLELRESSDSQ